jgi:Zn-dependent protease with chaperone function
MLTFPFIGLVLLTFVTVVAVPCNLIAWPLLRQLERMRPQARSPLLLLFVAAPWLLGGGVLNSSVADLFFGACADGQVCLWNEDPRLVEHARALIVVPLLAGMALVALRMVQQLVVARRAVRALDRTSTWGEMPDLRVISSPAAVAFAARGLVFVSSGLRAALEPSEFRALLAHERAHLRRSDGACQLIARVLSCALLPPLRRRVLEALTLANEQCCDHEAGQAEGRLVTASAILATERLQARASPVPSPAFAESFVPLRVRRLMTPEPAPWRAAAVYGSIICGVLSVFLLGDLLYYVGMLLLYPTSFA